MAGPSGKDPVESMKRQSNCTNEDGHRFLHAFNYYIRIDVSCVRFSEDNPHRFLETLQATNTTLCHELTRLIPSFSLTTWPGLFVQSKAESLQSLEVGQERGCFLIGIKPENEDDRLHEHLNELSQHLQRIELDICSHPSFLDEQVPPSVFARCVKQARLGRLIVDEWIWPQTAATPLTFTSTSDDSIPSYDFLIDAPIDIKEEVSTRSSTKLRPASDVLSRLRWDPEVDSDDFVVVYLDRFTGFKEISLDQWKSDTSDDEFIPQHRITAFKQRSTGEIVWHRAEKIDKIFRGDGGP